METIYGTGRVVEKLSGRAAREAYPPRWQSDWLSS